MSIKIRGRNALCNETNCCSKPSNSLVLKSPSFSKIGKATKWKFVLQTRFTSRTNIKKKRRKRKEKRRVGRRKIDRVASTKLETTDRATRRDTPCIIKKKKRKERKELVQRYTYIHTYIYTYICTEANERWTHWILQVVWFKLSVLRSIGKKKQQSGQSSHARGTLARIAGPEALPGFKPRSPNRGLCPSQAQLAREGHNSAINAASGTRAKHRFACPVTRFASNDTSSQ